MLSQDSKMPLHEKWSRGRVDYQDIAFARNHGLFSIDEQDALAEAVVAIPGLGGVGGQHLISLVRCGFRRFRLAEPDRFELVNVNRQAGASIDTLGRKKLDVMCEMARAINPFIETELFADGVTEGNLDAFLGGATMVVDGLDFFVFDMRRRMFMRAKEMGVPVITAGPLGFSTAMLVFSPRGMSFDEYFDIHDGLSQEECFLRFAMGLAPRAVHFRYVDRTRISLQRRKGPSSFIACQACAAMASMEAVRIVLGRPGLRSAPSYLQFDPYFGKLCVGRLAWGNRNPVQRAKLTVARTFLLARQGRIGHQEPAQRPRLPAPQGEQGGGVVSGEVFRYLVAAAVAAPSGDNVQPWRFSRNGDTLRVHMVAEADTSFFNIRQIATQISCGAAVENIVVAASELGLSADVRLPGAIGGDGLIAEVGLDRGASEADPLCEVIWERCTNRRLFKRKEISTGLVGRFAAEAERLGCRLHTVRGREDLKALGRLVFQADRIRTEHQGLHEHFAHMVRFTPQEAEQTRDGLPLKNLYGGFAGEQFLKLTRPWSAMRVANAIGAGRMVAMHSARGIVNSGAVCLLTAPGFGWADFVNGGRALERCWLKLTALGLAMQPMTAITLFRLRWDMEGEQAFSPRHGKMLKALWPEFDALFPAVDFSREGPVMLFRIGYARPIRYGPYRTPVEQFLM